MIPLITRSALLPAAVLVGLAVTLLSPAGVTRGAPPLSRSLTNAPAPAALSATPMVAVGGTHTCTLDATGGVRCWGRNAEGQLGDGTTTGSPRPTHVTGLDSGVVAIAAGSAHTCALTDTGGVKCWGSNGDGELGDFTQVNRTAPVDVIGLTSGVVAITAGDHHTCALLSGGGVDCWGYNFYGQVGSGTSGNSWLGAVPVCASGSGFGCTGGSALTGAGAISAGGNNTCAVTGGALLCWGSNYNGQLGQGFAPNKPIPDNNTCPTSASAGAECVSLPVGVPGLGSGITSASAGDTTCALTTGGGELCWGFNAHGEVGNGTTSPANPNVNTFLYPPSYPEPNPASVNGLTSGVGQISGSCASFASTGGMTCWGDNALGEVGDGTTQDRTSPVQVSGLTSGVSQFSASATVCGVVAAGGLKCWGSNSFGQLGTTTLETCSFGIPCSTVPVDVVQCTVCVKSLVFQVQVYPDDVNWVNVGSGGTTDGNQVRVVATIENQNSVSADVTVEFLEAQLGTTLPNASFNVTVPANGMLPVTYTWDTTGYSWAPGNVPKPSRLIRANVLQGANVSDFSVRQLTLKPKPVVLVHGFVSDYQTWSAYQGFLSGVRSDWHAYAVGDGQAPGVMNTGSLAHVATLTNTIDENAIVMSGYVNGVRTSQNAWHVDVVAHSMGGLISRDYIQYWMPPDAYGSPVMSHLIMLGTPNQGTSCADIGSPLGVALVFPALLQLTRTYVRDIFDTQVTDRKNVPFSISLGNPIPNTCLEGPGDIVVPHDTAISTSANPLDTIADNETRFIIHTAMTKSQPTFDQFVLPHLAVPPGAGVAAAATSALGAAVTNVVPPPGPSPQQLTSLSATIPAGGTADLPITVTDGSQIGATLLLPTEVTSILRDPSNADVATVTANTPEAEAAPRTLYASSPTPGTWTLHLENTGLGAVEAAGSAWVQGSAVALDLAPPIAHPDGTVSLAATLTDGASPVTGATVAATLTGSGGALPALPLFDDGAHGDIAAGDGVYGGTTSVLADGLYGIGVHATAPGIDRLTSGAVEASSQPATPTVTSTATSTVTPAATSTSTATPGPTWTSTPTPTVTSTTTSTVTSTATFTSTPTASSTSTPTFTSTAVATATNTPTPTTTPSPTPTGPAQTFTIDSTNDATDANPGDGVCASSVGECTLRAAIMEANAHAGPDTISVPAGSYILALTGPDEDAGVTGDLDVTDQVTIQGVGAATTIIDGNGGNPRDRVFHVHGAAGSPQVEIDGITITGGSPLGDGGGIYNDHASLTLQMDEVRSNHAAGSNGESGGGIYNNGGNVAIRQSTLEGNTVSFNGDGGGIANVGAAATLSLSNDTISGNHAFIGGGVFNLGGTASLRNVTISANGFTGGGEGGGIDNYAGSMEVANTLFANNFANCGRSFLSLGHNLDTDGSCALSGPGDVSAVPPQSIDALLGPLQDNGGATRTYALLAGSPAIDGASDDQCESLDQRGVSRPQDGNGDGIATCDIGAFEAEPGEAASPTPTETPVPVDTDTPSPTGTPSVADTATNTPVPTETNTPAPVPTDTPVPTATDTPTLTTTSSPTATATSAPAATGTPIPTATPSATSSPTPTVTATPAPAATDTPIPTATPSATSSPTPTVTATAAPAATDTPVRTATPSATSSPTPTVTATPAPAATDTPVPTATSTGTVTSTSTPPATITAVPTATNTATPTATPSLRGGRCDDDDHTARGRSHDFLSIVSAWARRSDDARYDLNGDGRVDLRDVLKAMRERRCEHHRGASRHERD